MVFGSHDMMNMICHFHDIITKNVLHTYNTNMPYKYIHIQYTLYIRM